MSRVERIAFRPYDFALKKGWTTSAGTASRRRGWLVEIRDETGRRGFGDCPADAPGHTALAACESDLDLLCNRIGGVPIEEALPGLPASGVASAAVECALLDLKAQSLGQPLCRLLEPGAASSVAVNAVTSLAGIPGKIAAGYRVIKMKVGVAPVEEEIHKLRSLSLPSWVRLRLDANQAWSWDEAARFLDAMADQPIDSLEEPLAQPSLERLAALQATTELVLAIDESLPAFGADAILAMRPVRRLVLKLGAVGGLTGTLDLARRAAREGVRSVVTSRLDSAVGVVAAAHLAAAIDYDCSGGLEIAHGLATSEWLAEDVCPAPVIASGRLILDRRPGLGLEMT